MERREAKRAGDRHCRWKFRRGVIPIGDLFRPIILLHQIDSVMRRRITNFGLRISCVPHKQRILIALQTTSAKLALFEC